MTKHGRKSVSHDCSIHEPRISTVHASSEPQSEQHACTGHTSYASGTTPSVVCGRIGIGDIKYTECKKGRKIKNVRRGGKGKHKHDKQSCNVYYGNINGFKFKIGSLQNILDEQNVGILLLAETKVYSKQSVKLAPGISFCQEKRVGRWTVNCCEAWSLHINDD